LGALLRAVEGRFIPSPHISGQAILPAQGADPEGRKHQNLPEGKTAVRDGLRFRKRLHPSGLPL
jgi:hypothetical protein